MIVTSSYNILTLLLIILASILTSVLASIVKAFSLSIQRPKIVELGNAEKSVLKPHTIKLRQTNSCRKHAEIETEQIRLKEEAVREYEKLLKHGKEVADDMDIDSNSESVGDDDKEVESNDESDLQEPSSSRIEESDNGDASDSDFESERDSVSNDEEVDEERMKKSFQEVWDCGTNQ